MLHQMTNYLEKIKLEFWM